MLFNGRSGPLQKRARRNYERAWKASVPADKAPLGLAPTTSFLRTLSSRFPDVAIRYDRRPRRRCFVLWEHTRAGDWVVIKDVPKGMGFDQRIIDYLALCDFARYPGVQSVIDRMDGSEADAKEAARTTDRTDYERILWAAKREYGEAMSRPMGVRSAVPEQIS